MALGPGKYDEHCTTIRTVTRARAVVLVVVDGVHGGGFSVQAPPEFTLALPKLLRAVADSIERNGT
jgi:hypothetical protein